MPTKLLKNHRFWLAIALLGGFLLCAFGPLKLLFDQSFLVNHLQRAGPWAVCLFVSSFAIATVLGIPGILFPIVAGAVFGLFWGTFWSVIAATLGSVGAFFSSRYLLRDWAERRFGRHKALRQFNQAVCDRPLTFVLAVRFVPISPFTIVNFLLGLTPLSWITYTVGTFLGIIPGTLAYTWLGVTGNLALKGGDRLPFFLALGFLALLCLLPSLAAKKGLPPNSSDRDF